MSLKIAEIFYSLQGEGLRAGTANTFIRLQGCNVQSSCYKSGVWCDTEFESGTSWTLDAIHKWIETNAHGCTNLVWTGGEPAQQLTSDIVKFFQQLGFYQALETSGAFTVPSNLDYVTVSPKVAEHIVAKHFSHVDELRYVRHSGQSIPSPKVTANAYFISPHSHGDIINRTNLSWCIDLVKRYPNWRLSVQQHKLWGVL